MAIDFARCLIKRDHIRDPIVEFLRTPGRSLRSLSGSGLIVQKTRRTNRFDRLAQNS